MRIIKEAFLVAKGREHPPSARHLDVWRKTVKAMAWRNLVEVRQSYPDTDAVKVRSGRTVLVFNIRRNDYRLIAAAHFNRQIVYVMRFMTHAEYSKDRWKETL
ncbi:MAG: type II toxin-antitoxin system HigB family toxin [Verrucomicrobiia bacterium]